MAHTRYFAVVFCDFNGGRIGYVHDFYPEERRAIKAEWRKHIRGEFATAEEAAAKIMEILRR
jgi:hypothetical protein